MLENNKHGWRLPQKDTLLTPASYITFLRTIAAVGVGLYALVVRNELLLLLALVIYWSGDILDGYIARRMHCEMRSGAMLDIVSDRLCVAVIYLVYAFFNPEMTLAIGLYLFEFMLIDTFLSLSFLFWPLLSPNYFFLVDKLIYQLNWSVIGKAANSSIFLLATILFNNVVLSTGIAIILISLKTFSIYRLYKIGIPNPSL